MSARPTGGAPTDTRLVARPVLRHSGVVGLPLVAPLPDGAVHGWAVAEIQQDGTVGHWSVVPAPAEGVRAVDGRAASPGGPAPAGPALDLRLGQLEAARGRHGGAIRCMDRALRSARTPAVRHSCLAEMALLEAYVGRLNRSADYDGLATKELPGAASDVLELAGAWRDFARGDLAEARARLDCVEHAFDLGADSWYGTLAVLLGAELSRAADRPVSALRMLSAAPPLQTGTIASWSEGVLAAARAECLLAAGESDRALALVTPLPVSARAEAGVVAADARAAIGDIRGALAVLAAVRDEVDVAPLATQVRAWLLEARIEHHRGSTARARVLVTRALDEATAEGMRTPLRRESRWLRAVAGSDVALQRTHRGAFHDLGLTQQRLEGQAAARASSGGATSPDDRLPCGTLTARERDVLDLLAAMYSTEEIAATLYVSSNTVKTHLKGIFTKLTVNRRVDAVRRGRQLGLC
jgi:LuxR family maltose regulon positive regulatory protein